MRLRYFFTNEQSSPVDVQIDAVLEAMTNTDPADDEYAKLVARLNSLYEIKRKDRRDPISKDTLAICITNIVGIMVIVVYENKHVLTSQGMRQLIRPKGPNQA